MTHTHAGTDCFDPDCPVNQGGVPLSFFRLREVNGNRVVRWHPDDVSRESWSLADWANACAGEMGEACNIVKKIRRVETGVAARPTETDRANLIEKLAGELADTIIYIDLLAAEVGIDLGAAVAVKFNATSEEYGFPERLP